MERIPGGLSWRASSPPGALDAADYLDTGELLTQVPGRRGCLGRVGGKPEPNRKSQLFELIP